MLLKLELKMLTKKMCAYVVLIFFNCYYNIMSQLCITFSHFLTQQINFNDIQKKLKILKTEYVRIFKLLIRSMDHNNNSNII